MWSVLTYAEGVCLFKISGLYTSLFKLFNHSDVTTYLEPYILECEVKWSLGSITMNKASESDGIPAELFKILKDDAL